MLIGLLECHGIIPTPHQTCTQYSTQWQNVQLILFSYSAAVLHIFFALKEEGHYNGCARHKPKHKPRFWPQTKRITPMLHRKWIIWDLSYCNFSTKYETITSYWKQWLCTVLRLKAPVTTSCWNKKSCFQETAPSFHLNCWIAHGEEHLCLWAVWNTSMQAPDPNSCQELSCTCLVKVEAVETKLPENVMTNTQHSHAGVWPD